MKLIYYSIANILNIGVFSTLIFFSIKASTLDRLFLYMTILSFTCSTIYLILKQVQIIKLTTYEFIENRLFKCLYSLSMMVCFGFWFLTLGGDSIMPYESRDDATFLYVNIYLHGIIGLFMFIDLIIHERKVHEGHYYVDLIILIIITGCYSVFITMLSYNHDITVYPFIKNVELKTTIGLFSVVALILFNAYQSYYFIVRRKVNYSKKDYLL